MPRGGLKRVEACERRNTNQPRAPFDLSFPQMAAGMSVRREYAPSENRPFAESPAQSLTREQMQGTTFFKDRASHAFCLRVISFQISQRKRSLE